jgi:peptidoglycan/xylan/chitin deacetylase (PgdA/CDA1 family)
MKKITLVLCSIVSLFSACSKQDRNIGHTEITKWLNGKPAAISITYDDASINQFRFALPIMDTLGFKGTFFINTVDIPQTEFPPQYFGRPIPDIIKETATKPTDQKNLFERASALRFTGVDGAVESHNQAGSLYEQDKAAEAFKVIDEAYAKVRKQKSVKPTAPKLLEDAITWPELKAFAANGHEFGNHTISHPRLSVLDEQNLLYELEKCKEEILKQLGPEHTFSAECPFGTENERVMQYAYKIHPALRNRMPEPFLEELNRGSKANPGESKKEYVQYQRGPLSKTPIELMKSWVDTLLVHNNIWLVLTFHGVDGIGWEANPHEKLAEYFRYMKQKEDRLWVATFKDVTKYMRERMSSKINVTEKGEKIKLDLTHSLDKDLYNHPLTLKTYVPSDWKEIKVTQGGKVLKSDLSTDEKGTFVLYEALPNAEAIEVTQ